MPLSFVGTDETAGKERYMEVGGRGRGGAGWGGGEWVPHIRLVGNLSRQYPNHSAALPPPSPHTITIVSDKDIERGSLAGSVADFSQLQSDFIENFFFFLKKGQKPLTYYKRPEQENS